MRNVDCQHVLGVILEQASGIKVNNDDLLKAVTIVKQELDNNHWRAARAAEGRSNRLEENKDG